MKRIGNIISQISPVRMMILVGLASLVGLVGCTGDDAPETSEEAPQTLTIIASTSSFLEVNPWSTRALPTGYVPYETLYPRTTPPNTTIGVFMTPERADASFDFIYDGYHQSSDPINDYSYHKWTSSVGITDGTQYYIYGFMPKEDAQNVTITNLDGHAYDVADEDSWSAGAIMSLTMNTVTAADVCVIVGVMKDPTLGVNPPPIGDSDIQLGQFGYVGGAKGTNYVYLLLKHLYAGLHFTMSLDANYASLRTVKVTGMEIEANDAFAETINMQVTLTANNTNTDPVTVSAPNTTGSATASAVLFPWAGGQTEITVPTVPDVSDYIGCFAPNTCTNFTLRTTFDVYDKQGNLTRKGAVAENKVSIVNVDMAAGDVYTFNLTIKPTYLYVMSDPDLENPTIVIN